MHSFNIGEKMTTYRDIDFSFNKKIKSRLISVKDANDNISVDINGEPLYTTVYDIKSTEDVAAIIRSIKNIVLTLKGEVKFDYDFGTTFFRSLFENMPLGNKEIFLQEKIKETIAKYEPRVRIQQVQTKYNYDENYMIMDVTVKILETQRIINIPIILQRTR